VKSSKKNWFSEKSARVTALEYEKKRPTSRGAGEGGVAAGKWWGVGGKHPEGKKNMRSVEIQPLPTENKNCVGGETDT